MLKQMLAASVAMAAVVAMAKTYTVTPETIGMLLDEIAADRDAACKAGGYSHPTQVPYADEIVFKSGYYRLADLYCRDGRANALFPFELKVGKLTLRSETGDPNDVTLDGAGVKCIGFRFWEKGEVRISGLTFANFVNADPKVQGSALAIHPGHTTNLVENCVFRNNRSAGLGGAVVGGNYRRCRFEANSAVEGGAFYGGDWRSISGQVEDCVFIGNHAEKCGGAAAGGSFSNCLFVANSCPTGNCSAIVGHYPQSIIAGCTFRGNVAPIRKSFSRGVACETVYCVEPRGPFGVTNNVVESWGYGMAGEKGNGQRTDRVVVAPGESIIAARDFLRQHRTPGARAEIVLKSGVHVLTNTVHLSGLDAKLTIRSERGDCGAIIAGGWTFAGRDFAKSQTRPGLLEIEVPAELRTNFVKGAYEKLTNFREIQFSPPVLSIDGAAMIPGRWPNGRQYFYGTASNLVQRGINRSTTNAFYSTFTGREAKWDWDNNDIVIWGELGGCGFSKEFWTPRRYDAERQAMDMGYRNIAASAHLCFYNVLEEVDEPGEWCYDRAAGKIVLCPPKDFKADSICVLGLMTDNFFKIESDDVVIEGLAFTGKRGRQSIDIFQGYRNQVLGCRFSALSYAGGVTARGMMNEIRSCDFYDIYGEACDVKGGDVINLVYSSNRIENCTFRHCKFMQNQNHAPAVLGVGGCGNIVAHNQVWDTIAQGLGFGGADNIIEYNRLWDVTSDNSDSNAIGTGGSFAGYGTHIRYNDVASSPTYTHGIYCDDFSGGVRIYGNIVHDYGQWGIFLGGGRDHIISNNIVTAGWGGVHTDNRGNFWPAWRKKDEVKKNVAKMFGLPNSPFAKKYPKLVAWCNSTNDEQLCSPTGLEIVNNLFLDIRGYSSLAFVALNRGFPDSDNYARGNLAVRPVGVREGYFDLAAGDASNAPTNAVSGGIGAEVLRPYFPVRVLDGTKENPVDLGFKKPNQPSFDLQDCMFMREGWLDTGKYIKVRATGRFDNIKYERGDYTIADDARLYREIPGFERIPWEKIGLYTDKWRRSLPR